MRASAAHSRSARADLKIGHYTSKKQTQDAGKMPALQRKRNSNQERESPPAKRAVFPCQQGEAGAIL